MSCVRDRVEEFVGHTVSKNHTAPLDMVLDKDAVRYVMFGSITVVAMLKMALRQRKILLDGSATVAIIGLDKNHATKYTKRN